MTRIFRILVTTAAVVALVAGPALAQMAPAPLARPAPAAPGASGAPGAEIMPKEKQVEGPVKLVDPAAKTVKVGWFLGIFRTTLEVTDNTQIMAEGKKGSLFDIREGAKVKASYETRNGKNIAKSIEVLAAQEPEKAAGASGSPAPTGGSMESPGRPAAPPAGRAGT